MATKKSHAGVWIIIAAAVVLEATACVQYFTSHAAVKRSAVNCAESELRKAELEIQRHTVEMETAAKTLVMLVEKHVDNPENVFAATRSVVKAIENTSSLAVAYVPGYFPKYGRLFEACSSRISEDSIYTRQIGNESHDYTLLEWYQNGFVHDSCWWCDPYLDDSGSKAWVVSCSCPVRNQKGEIVAVVCVDLALDYLEDLSEFLQIYKDSYYSIHSSLGTEIVAAPDTVPGRKYYTFHEEIEATGWHLAIIIPDDVLFADLRRTGLIITIMMLLGLCLLTFLVVHATRTVRELIRSMEKNQRMETELHIARAIQMAMLPNVFPPFMDRPDLNIYGMVEPAKEIGGDLYDFYIRHDKLFFCVGDVSGKGVPAALVMAMTRSLFRSVTSREEESDVIVRKINRAFCDQNSQNMFLTLFLGVLDYKTGVLDYCNAGHNAPVLLGGSAGTASVESLPVLPNLPLGIEPDFEFKAQSTQLHYDDILFLYTDGLTEAENGAHEQFGERRMMEMLQVCRESMAVSPREIIGDVQRSVETFVGSAQQSDDLTMLAIRYQRPALLMRNDIEQIPTLSEWIDGLDIPAGLNMQINLALEEIVSNVMLYAYPGTAGQVLVEAVKARNDRRGTERIIFTVSDNGIPFDPTKQAEVDTSLSAEERPIGGLGIHLVRQIMDEVRYERIEDKNVLTLVKNV